jgi:hypothetical protein
LYREWVTLFCIGVVAGNIIGKVKQKIRVALRDK